MSFAKTHSGQSYCLNGQIIDIEVDISKGLYAFSIVGLPDKAVEEARDRISAAIKNSGFISPKQKNHKVVISLAPAHVRKEGSHFDLAMALGYLLASNDVSFDPNKKLFIGELSLNGTLRKASGVLPVVIEAQKNGYKDVYIPKANIGETRLIDNINIFGISNLAELVEILDPNSKRVKVAKAKIIEETFSEPEKVSRNKNQRKVLLEEIIGQPLAKRGLEIAAAGGHNVLMIGPPGTGKTMLANAFRNLLPELNYEQSIEVTSIHSVAGLTADLISHAPFRSPHHTSSYASLVGGGSVPRPGEITLAHRGVLFLDEFPEFDRRVIETLRQPLEEKIINIARAKNSASFPAHFILIAAMNPCPCGHRNSQKNKCTCTTNDVLKYRKRISGPLLDRIDLFVEVNDIDYSKFSNQNNERGDETLLAQKKILVARQRQKERHESGDRKNILNSEMSGGDLSLHSRITNSAAETLIKGTESFNLSMRSYHRVWRVARTIADLENSDVIKEEHVLEAFQFRRSEQFN